MGLGFRGSKILGLGVRAFRVTSGLGLLRFRIMPIGSMVVPIFGIRLLFGKVYDYWARGPSGESLPGLPRSFLKEGRRCEGQVDLLPLAEVFIVNVGGFNCCRICS